MLAPPSQSRQRRVAKKRPWKDRLLGTSYILLMGQPFINMNESEEHG
jgi:hypothetical protein